MNRKLNPLSKAEKRLARKLTRRRMYAQAKFPLLFGLLATFGFILVLKGIERLIAHIGWLNENGWVLFGTGLFVLIATGSVYRKLN